MMAWLLKHLPVLPIVLPLLGAALVLLAGEKRLLIQRVVTTACVVSLLGFAVLAIMLTASGQMAVYLAGNWQAPFGIVLAIDKLTALMLVLTATIGTAVLMAVQTRAKTIDGGRKRIDEGTFFYPLFLLQLAGLNGAFLTADLFNLFVFFEVLLAASYGMLLQSADRSRTNAATHYVVINLLGSALFLIAVSLLYGVTGTLNMSDLSQKINAVPSTSRGLVMSAGFVLLVVFAIKAALLPLNFWLTGTYGRALLPVAALFALMTKVGVVAIARILTLVFPEGGLINSHMSAVLLIAAPLTMLVAACGALAAREVRVLIGWTVVASAGMLVTAIAIGSPKALSGALFYMLGSTVATALLFLNAAAIDAPAAQVMPGAACKNRAWPVVGVLFFTGAAAAASLPPFSGFIGKTIVLVSATQHAWMTWILCAVLIAGFLTIIAFARMGSRLFWKRDAAVAPLYLLPASLLAVALVALTLLAAPIQRFTDQAAIEMKRPQIMTGNVLGKLPLPSDKTTGAAK